MVCAQQVQEAYWKEVGLMQQREREWSEEINQLRLQLEESEACIGTAPASKDTEGVRRAVVRNESLHKRDGTDWERSAMEAEELSRRRLQQVPSSSHGCS